MKTKKLQSIEDNWKEYRDAAVPFGHSLQTLILMKRAYFAAFTDALASLKSAQDGSLEDWDAWIEKIVAELEGHLKDSR